MICDLIIDRNYILNKNVFTLNKNNRLYGDLFKSLDIAITSYKKLYNFTNVYLVSDSKEKSWRKDLNVEYKASRKKDDNVDWNFVYQCYVEFKKYISDSTTILESPHIEGDDWISYLVHNSNNHCRSTVIISNDYDIKQLISFSIEPMYINIMINELFNNKKMFLPKNYHILLNKINNAPNTLFNMNNDIEFLNMIKELEKTYNIQDIDSTASLVIKILSGDISDNIESVYTQVKNNKRRGIGPTGANTIYGEYLKQYKNLPTFDDSFYENIAYVVCEKRKISMDKVDMIKENIIKNNKLINLDVNNLPRVIYDKMDEIYSRHNK